MQEPDLWIYSKSGKRPIQYFVQNAVLQKQKRNMFWFFDFYLSNATKTEVDFCDLLQKYPKFRYETTGTENETTHTDGDEQTVARSHYAVPSAYLRWPTMSRRR